MDGDGTVNPVDNGNIEARMEEGDETSEVSTLKSMGYIDDGTEISQEESTTSDVISTLQTVVILAIVAFFLFGVLYLVGETVFSMLGI